MATIPTDDHSDAGDPPATLYRPTETARWKQLFFGALFLVMAALTIRYRDLVLAMTGISDGWYVWAVLAVVAAAAVDVAICQWRGIGSRPLSAVAVLVACAMVDVGIVLDWLS